MEKENLAKIACECLNLDCPEPDLSDWKSMVNDLRHPDKEVRIALVGKYTALHDAYISVCGSFKARRYSRACNNRHQMVDSKN